MTWRLTTDAQRERFNAAKDAGGLCATCGRALDAGELVYIEPVAVERKPLTAPGARWPERPAIRDAPLGAECASPGFLARSAGQTPEPCVGCSRPMHYAKDRAVRQRALCSRDCRNRAYAAERAARTEGTR